VDLALLLQEYTSASKYVSKTDIIIKVLHCKMVYEINYRAKT
jgi:hypothetical protein